VTSPALRIDLTTTARKSGKTEVEMAGSKYRAFVRGHPIGTHVKEY